ncbi:MAG: Do family serine endopeptidase [Treponemataceae bacterium]
MKQSKKFILILALILLIPLFSASCKVKENAQIDTQDQELPFIEENRTEPEISKDSLAVVEAMQKLFREVSEEVLKSVVEVDVVETKTRNIITPFDLPYFFFGNPENEDGSFGRQREYKQQGLGSGVIVMKNKNTYYVLTNNHVAGSANEISVKLYDSREFKCKLVGNDERKDIALISFESKDNIPVAKLGNSDKVRTGDICFAMGTPLGYFSSVTQGIISATGRSGSAIGNISDFIQTDASINQGNSGGPLVNIYGEVIGINTWIASSSGGSVGLGFAIPINNVKKSINDFVTKGKASYGWLGVNLYEADKDFLKELGVENQTGAFVSHIFLNSPATKGGMKAGDYIIKLNGKNIKNVTQLVNDVGMIEAGTDSEFVVIRDGQIKNLTVKIEARDDSAINDFLKLWPGFLVSPISDEVRKEMKLAREVDGVVVLEVQPKSPASVLRLQSRDIITSVNGKKIKNVRDFYRELSSNVQECWFECYTAEGQHTFETQKYRF